MNPDMDERDHTEVMDLQIVDNLKRAYNETLSEAVPDRFFDLLRKLREAESKDSDAGPDGDQT